MLLKILLYNIFQVSLLHLFAHIAIISKNSLNTFRNSLNRKQFPLLVSLITLMQKRNQQRRLVFFS